MCQLQRRRDASLAEIKHFDIFEFKDCSNGTISRKDGLYIMIFCDLALMSALRSSCLESVEQVFG
jgi:hypothetical protein